MDKEYSLTHKQHKELFPYRKHKFGMIKYRYFDNGNIGIKYLCSRKQHLSIDYIGAKTETYKKFMKYAKVKKINRLK